jgi:hypothetical protein
MDPSDPTLGASIAGVPRERWTTMMDAISGWIKSNPLIVLAGALTTIFGLIISTSNVVPVILKAIDRPDCFTYSSVYHGPWSEFRFEGGLWREYPREGGVYRYEFKEVHRNRDNIDMLNLTPRPDTKGWETLMVRLPVCGGTAKINIGIVQRWADLFQVWRD